jgi:hypothetical protein
MEKESEHSRFVYDDTDELEVFDMEDLEVKPVEKKKPIAASAISEFIISSNEEK